MRDSKDEIRKQLDAVVGESYEPPRRWKPTALKWLAAAVLAVGMAFVVVGILDLHVTKAQKSAVQKRPIPIHIVPAK